MTESEPVCWLYRTQAGTVEFAEQFDEDVHSFPVYAEPQQILMRNPNEVDRLRSALQAAIETIQDYLAYEHDGDPWSEDSRAMGEMDINDYAKDGRLEYALSLLSAPSPQSKTLASKEELNEIARALQDLWSVVKPEPRPSPFDAVWREYAAEIRRVVLKNTPPQEHLVGDQEAADFFRKNSDMSSHGANKLAKCLSDTGYKLVRFEVAP